MCWIAGGFARRACRALDQHRSTQRHVPTDRDDEERLVADMIKLANPYGCYGYYPHHIKFSSEHTGTPIDP